MAIGRPVSLTSNVASKTISATATANQTLFTVTGGYLINQLAVFRNGVRLVDAIDYTARDGSTVTLLSPATVGDTLEFQVFDNFQVADAINSYSSPQIINGNLSIGSSITFYGETGIVTAVKYYGDGSELQGVTGGGGLGTAISYSDGTSSPFSYIDKYATVTENLNLDNTVAGGSTSYVVSVIPNITIASGVGVTVGTGKTMIIDVLQIGDL